MIDSSTCAVFSLSGASDLNKTSAESWRPETPTDWQLKKEDGDKPELPAGMNESVFNSLMDSQLFKDLKDMEEMLKNTKGLKPGVKGQ